MSNTIRIRTTPNGSDKYLKVKLEQDFDFVEILSLKISQEDTYRKFCSDYGAIVGRVIINNGFGVPNAKVSVFIPLDDIDKSDPLINGLYPYEVITDKNSDGVRYNLLPKEAEISNECFTPIGTFPSKREILDNDVLLEVYCKYYKFTTTTNHAGDFMIFGVPLGTYTVHVDADISNIGVASQRPYDLISQGTPSKMFTSPTKFKSDRNLDKLIQVKTMNAGVNVQPFWGDIENCEIGITRLDFDLNHSIRPAAIFMGSIYGDQDKHSVNKRCRPRKKLGLLCDQVTGPGSVDMIRKTIDGQIEEFSVDGGRVIDDDGTWAYQIPMNLDYMVTDEEGNLILSQDPNIGVPTRARVRFNIGLDETGGEGRLRTRARYLVPNNPTNANEVDYEFGADTKDTSFRDLYWNKIYSVSNFVSRFQKQANLTKTRSMTAIKDVDACAGDKTPFPYNRVDTEINPIFFIICLIIKIVSLLIFVMNSTLIPLINVMIKAISIILNTICSVINAIINILNQIPLVAGMITGSINCPTINYIPCISVQCPADDGNNFAPGCKNGGLDGGLAYAATSPTPNDKGLDDCIAFEMAKSLDLFQFDFYNDWVNGSLFSYLLKYKKKRKGREKFCEYECSGSGTFTAVDGVDGNDNGVGDNDCHNNLLLDTCYNGGNNSQNEARSVDIRDGLIKKVGDEFFYAATTHNVTYKLFATEIINLGSIFECDWQGIPTIQDLLIPTSYKLPPDINEIGDNGSDIETCGMVGLNGANGEFFSINCLGVHVDWKECLNIRHICEIGVDIDQAKEDPITGAIIASSDCIIGVNDIDDDRGKWFRDVFYGLNKSNTPWIGINTLTIPAQGYDTNFNLSNLPTYDFSSISNNGRDYVSFRGFINDSSYSQPKHSFFFYFGLLPGKTALDKMNQRFFTHCNTITNEDILIHATSTPTTTVTGLTGTIVFKFIGGTGPYTYTVTGVAPIGYMVNGTTNLSVTLTGLAAGSYIITGVDSLGTPVTKKVLVSGPTPLYSVVSVTKNATTAISNDGEITISSVGGGVGPYQYEVKSFLGTTIAGPALLSVPKIIGGLAIDNTNGYKVFVTDSSLPISTHITSGLTVTGPSTISLSTSKTDVTCYGYNTGTINLTIAGGQGPYIVSTTGPAGYNSASINMIGLAAGTYVTTVVDVLGTSASITTVINTLNSQMTIVSASAAELAKQCDPTQYFIPFYISAGASPGPVNVEYNIDFTGYVPITLTYVNPATPLILNITTAITNTIVIRFLNASGTCSSNLLGISNTSITLPPTLLALNLNNISNVKQCVPNQVTFKFNINDFTRPPYTYSYNVNGVGPITGLMLTNPMVITKFVGTTNSIIDVVVTDANGCITPTLNLNINTPASPLTCYVATTGPILGQYTHTVSGSGGIAPYTGVGTFSNPNPTITTSITDSVGCISPYVTG